MGKVARRNALLTAEQDRMIFPAIKCYRTLNENDLMKKCIDEAMDFFTGSSTSSKNSQGNINYSKEQQG